MGRRSVLIVGTVRNCESKLRETYSRLQKSFVDFDVDWLLVESDSDDRTVSILQELARENSKFTYKSFGNLRDKMPFRTQRLAYCRNWYTHEAADLGKYDHIQFVVAADFDGINNLITRDAVNSCWNFSDWDVVSANQRGKYYDIWCLRHISWSRNDCWKDYKELRDKGFSHKKAARKAVFSRMIKINPKSNWIEVDSAYGGLTIYKKEAFIAGEHIWQDENGNETCEIVAYHEDIRQAGFRIFINPKLINGGMNEHSRQSTWKFQTMQSIKQLISRG